MAEEKQAEFGDTPDKKTTEPETPIKKQEDVLSQRTDTREAAEKTASTPVEEFKVEDEPDATATDQGEKPEDDKGDGSEDEPKADLTSEERAQRAQEKINRRIGREVSKRKSAEEQAQELAAENDRLREQLASKQPVGALNEEKKEPTTKDCAAALKKAREDGDVEFEAEIIEYIAERKAKAEREAAETQYQKQNQTRQLAAQRWATLVDDYTPRNDKGEELVDSPLNLNNRKSLLFVTAKRLYEDKEFRKELYTGEEGMRRAVGDAYRELVEGNLVPTVVAQKPNGQIQGNTDEASEQASARNRLRRSLGAPAAESADATEGGLKSAAPRSANEKIADEIRSRRKYAAERSVPLARQQ